MEKIFALDGRWYDVFVPTEGIKRNVSILDTDLAGRTEGGGIDFDTIGTYYNYTITVLANKENPSDYDALHRQLRNPKTRKHLITVPFDQRNITYEAYIASLDDTLAFTKNGVNYWNALSIKFAATDPNETV